jgi:hypothetical protein
MELCIYWEANDRSASCLPVKETKRPLPCSQQRVTDPYTEPVQSNSQPLRPTDLKSTLVSSNQLCRGYLFICTLFYDASSVTNTIQRRIIGW